MAERPDFGDDLSELSKDVSREVFDVLNAVKERKRASKVHGMKTIELSTATESDAASAPSEANPESSSALGSVRRASRAERRAATSERDVILENVTTRLSRTTNELLTEATLRQRLKKAVPATRQDIIEEALGDWLKRHGYRRD